MANGRNPLIVAARLMQWERLNEIRQRRDTAQMVLARVELEYREASRLERLLAAAEAGLDVKPEDVGYNIPGGPA